MKYNFDTTKFRNTDTEGFQILVANFGDPNTIKTVQRNKYSKNEWIVVYTDKRTQQVNMDKYPNASTVIAEYLKQNFMAYYKGDGFNRTPAYIFPTRDLPRNGLTESQREAIVTFAGAGSHYKYGYGNRSTSESTIRTLASFGMLYPTGYGKYDYKLTDFGKAHAKALLSKRIKETQAQYIVNAAVDHARQAHIRQFKNKFAVAITRFGEHIKDITAPVSVNYDAYKTPHGWQTRITINYMPSRYSTVSTVVEHNLNADEFEMVLKTDKIHYKSATAREVAKLINATYKLEFALNAINKPSKL